MRSPRVGPWGPTLGAGAAVAGGTSEWAGRVVSCGSMDASPPAWPPRAAAVGPHSLWRAAQGRRICGGEGTAMCRARYAFDGRTTGSSPCRRSRRVAPGHTAGCRRAPRAVTRSQPRRGIGSAPVGAGVVRCPRRLRDGAGGVLGPLGKEPWGPRVARGRGEEQSAIACVIGSVPMRSLSRTGIWRAGGEAVACDRLAVTRGTGPRARPGRPWPA